MEKDFDSWHNLKIQIDSLEHLPTFNEREIWWCSIGMNIGYELYGKNDKFVRPVLILRKHSKFTFFGLPLTSKRKETRPSYYPLDFQKQEGSVILDQGRTLDSRRLIKLMGKLTPMQVESIRKAFKEII